ncbi:DUF1835 domain-containing protein [Paenibacillus sp. SC116]|uniref:DUF1835 domain-containing protein n=1 Tax=Paenibacillus sp. SC116 TaxID=2968986 RepID=UPI00215AED23|nr:DUF1835 domain-containing protein [Paenibacillus sp. SC116]MCR8842264.1 DUF1835 domain-containing protein [Paenibacillus sp. SC116]
MSIIQLPKKAIVGVIRSQPEQESKLYLMQVMAIVETLKQEQHLQEECCDKLFQIYEEMLTPPEAHSWEPTEECERVHIVVGDSFAGSMKNSLRELGREHSDKLICLRDHFAYGPLWHFHEREGLMRRWEWLQDHIHPGDDDDRDSIFRSNEHLMQQFERIPPTGSVYVWGANNAHEQSGLRYAIYLLRDKSNHVVLCDAVEMKQQLFHTPPTHNASYYSGELHMDKLPTILEHSLTYSPIDVEERRRLEQEWRVLSEDTGNLRVIKDGKVANVPVDYYDACLLQTVEQLHQAQDEYNFIKSARVIGQALVSAEQYVNDSYFEYRLRELIYSGMLEIKGIPRAMRYYSVKRSNGEKSKSMQTEITHD